MIKVRDAEKKLMDDYKNFKEIYLSELEGIKYGISLAKKFYNDETHNEKVDTAIGIIDDLKELIEQLKINTDKETDGNLILWFSCKISKNEEYYCRDFCDAAYPVTDKTVMYCLSEFLIETCKLISSFKILQYGFNDYFWDEMERKLKCIILKYINYLCFKEKNL